MVLGSTPIEEHAFRVLKALNEWGTQVPARAEDLRISSGLTVYALNEVIVLLEEMRCVEVARKLTDKEFRFFTALLTPHGRLVFQQSQVDRVTRTQASSVAVPIVDGAAPTASISEATRRNITDSLSIDKKRWCGRLDETDFLSRIYDLEKLGSNDGRFSTAAGDIFQHRVNNSDWEDDWVFADGRFELRKGPDEVFLKFLCETVHPVVRPDASEVAELVALYNRYLAPDGWEIADGMQLSGRPVFVAKRLPALGIEKDLSEQLAFRVDTSYVSNQVTRMNAAMEKGDYELAIGTAKELIETICKTILKARGVPADPLWDLPRLAKETARVLPLAPSTVNAQSDGVDAFRILINSLTTAIEKVGQLRSLFGTGHGKEADANGLHRRHAQFIAATASAVGIFLYETHTSGNTEELEEV